MCFYSGIRLWLDAIGGGPLNVAGPDRCQGRLPATLSPAINASPKKASPKIFPYANGPPVLSPWCTDQHADEAPAATSRCPFLALVTQSN